MLCLCLKLYVWILAIECLKCLIFGCLDVHFLGFGNFDMLDASIWAFSLLDVWIILFRIIIFVNLKLILDVCE